MQKVQRVMVAQPRSYTPSSLPLFSAPYKRPESLWKNATAITPNIPQQPCTWVASSGSSTLMQFINLPAPIYTKAERNPTTQPAHGSNDAHPAVTPTSPANIPLVRAEKSNLISFLPPHGFLKMKVAIPEADGAIIVLTIASAAD